MALALILFDFDFTLADTSNCLIPSLRRALQEVCSRHPRDEEIKRLIGVPLEKQYDILSGHVDRASFDEFRRIFLEERGKLEETGSVLIVGVKEALKSLSAKYTLGIVSTGQAGRIQRFLDHRGVIGNFCSDGILGGAANKAEGIRLILQKLRVGASSAVYVGDRPDDGAAAKKAGVSFVGVSSGAFTVGEFESGCSVLPSVADLPKFLSIKVSD